MGDPICSICSGGIGTNKGNHAQIWFFLADIAHRSLNPISTKVNAVQELKKVLAHHKKYIKGK
jgi:hypothetical protein